jgi:hypothetical protein
MGGICGFRGGNTTQAAIIFEKAGAPVDLGPGLYSSHMSAWILGRTLRPSRLQFTYILATHP